MNDQDRSGRILTPLKAIRANCIDCSGGQTKEVRECVIKHCPLYPYRMGKRPQTLAKKQEGEINGN